VVGWVICIRDRKNPDNMENKLKTWLKPESHKSTLQNVKHSLNCPVENKKP